MCVCVCGCTCVHVCVCVCVCVCVRASAWMCYKFIFFRLSVGGTRLEEEKSFFILVKGKEVKKTFG